MYFMEKRNVQKIISHKSASIYENLSAVTYFVTCNGDVNRGKITEMIKLLYNNNLIYQERVLINLFQNTLFPNFSDSNILVDLDYS